LLILKKTGNFEENQQLVHFVERKNFTRIFATIQRKPAIFTHFEQKHLMNQHILYPSQQSCGWVYWNRVPSVDAIVSGQSEHLAMSHEIDIDLEIYVERKRHSRNSDWVSGL
jgi:hypothetical protein